MTYFRVKNVSGQKIDLKPILMKLRPFCDLVSKDKFPLVIEIRKKKNKTDRSFFDMNDSRIVFKFDTSYQSHEEINWVTSHEFFHFIQKNNEEIGKTVFSKETDYLIKLFQKVFKIDESAVNELFHDFLPYEVSANTFATMIVGKFHKRHFFSTLVKFLTRKKMINK